MARSFLEKFSGTRQGPGTQDERAQVIRNLEAVLNTQEGYGYFVRGFGLGEYTEKRGTRALMETLTAEIQREIEKYEPRLKEVELTLRGRDGGLWLHFNLTGMVGDEPLELRLRFDTVSGRVRIEEKDT